MDKTEHPPSIGELTLQVVERLDSKVDKLTAGQAEIQAMLAVHEERSSDNRSRISRIEKLGITLFTGIVLALFSLGLSGCGFLNSLGRTPPPVEVEPDPPKIDAVARAVNNTVALTKPDGSVFCSGVAAEGTIITANHCANPNEDFRVRFRGGSYPGVVTASFPDIDLAFVDAIGARLKDTIPLADVSPSLGSKVVWLGYPLGLELIMGTGIIGNLDSHYYHFYAVYGQLIPGNSGGPVLNYKGDLLGIVSATMSYSFSLLPVGYVVPLPMIREALETSPTKE